MATVDNLDYLESSCIEGMYTLLGELPLRRERGRGLSGRAWPSWAASTASCRRTWTRRSSSRRTLPSLPVMEVTLASDQRSLVWLRDWADNWLAGPPERRAGTAGAEIVGGLEREIRVHLDPDAPARRTTCRRTRWRRPCARRTWQTFAGPRHRRDAGDHRPDHGRVREPRRDPRCRRRPRRRTASLVYLTRRGHGGGRPRGGAGHHALQRQPVREAQRAQAGRSQHRRGRRGRSRPSSTELRAESLRRTSGSAWWRTRATTSWAAINERPRLGR
ncbi:MAG: hypothetical protein MZV63_65705 [Marinilabiliales bacterium]|nr:hypothetical protein [Marinilabiliales bacterium]